DDFVRPGPVRQIDRLKRAVLATGIHAHDATSCLMMLSGEETTRDTAAGWPSRGYQPLSPTTAAKSQHRPAHPAIGANRHQTKNRCVYESSGDHDQPLILWFSTI